MSKRKIKAGSSNIRLPISVASTLGGGLTGLTSATSGLVAEYRRDGQSTWTAITLVAGTLGSYVNSGGAGTGGGFIVDGTAIGDYELCLPLAATDTGAVWVIVRLRGATNMVPVRIEIELDRIDYQDPVRAGLTALPNANSNAAGGLPVSTAGGLDMDDLGIDVDAIETLVAALTNAPTAAAVATAVAGKAIDGAITIAQFLALAGSIVAGNYADVRDTVAKTLTVTYYRVDRTTILCVMVTTYADTDLTQSVSRSVTWSNLP